MASCLEEPVPSWVDAIQGAGFSILAIATGMVNVIHHNTSGNSIYDVIPADTVCNAILISAADAGIKKKSYEIVNCASSGINPLTMK